MTHQTVLYILVLLFMGAEIVVGVFMALFPRDALHYQITSCRWLNWKSQTIPIEQEIFDLRIIGIVLVVTGSIAMICITHIDMVVGLIKHVPS